MDTRPPEQSASPDEQAKVRKAGMIMMGIFGVLTLLFFCGGLAAVGASGYNSESAGVTAMYVAVGPAMFALCGFIASLVGHFAIKENLMAKGAVPLVVGFLMGPCSLGCTFVFFQAIWPSL